MNKLQLRQHSRQTLKDAESLLSKIELLEILKPFGKVMVVGSMKYGLMFDLDIDIHIVSPKASFDRALKLHTQLIRTKLFTACYFGEWVEHIRPGFPRGYYLGLRKPFRGRRWKIDIWMGKKLSKVNDDDIRRLQESRQLVLACKEYRRVNRLPIYTWSIYSGILNKSIRRPKDIKKLL